MANAHPALTVILAENTRRQEIEALINAIKLLRGVVQVDAKITEMDSQKSVDASKVSIDVDDPSQEALLTMFASEAALAKEWNRPEEDEAWAGL